MPSESERDLDPRLLRAVAHPLRFRVLTRLNEVVASPKELSDELGEPLTNVAYHVTVLHRLGAIELVRTTPRRGATEHHYRAVLRPVLDDRDWAQLPRSTQKALTGTMLADALGDLRRAADAGMLEARDDWHLSYTTLTLDEAGWRELGTLMGEVLERALELQEQAGDDPIAARLTMFLYEGAPTPAPEAT
jgi:DNA-binding transcriptional ArsR family regulator